MPTKEVILRSCMVSVIENNGDGNYAFDAMDIWGKQECIAYENWKKSKGIVWCVNNAATSAEQLYEQFKSQQTL